LAQTHFKPFARDLVSALSYKAITHGESLSAAKKTSSLFRAFHPKKARPSA
jgi:hypothetical protein